MANSIEDIKLKLINASKKLEEKRKEFLANDGEISEQEQQKLDKIRGLINQAKGEVTKRTGEVLDDDGSLVGFDFSSNTNSPEENNKPNNNVVLKHGGRKIGFDKDGISEIGTEHTLAENGNTTVKADVTLKRDQIIGTLTGENKLWDKGTKDFRLSHGFAIRFNTSGKIAIADVNNLNFDKGSFKKETKASLTVSGTIAIVLGGSSYGQIIEFVIENTLEVNTSTSLSVELKDEKVILTFDPFILSLALKTDVKLQLIKEVRETLKAMGIPESKTSIVAEIGKLEIFKLQSDKLQITVGDDFDITSVITPGDEKGTASKTMNKSIGLLIGLYDLYLKAQNGVKVGLEGIESGIRKYLGEEAAKEYVAKLQDMHDGIGQLRREAIEGTTELIKDGVKTGKEVNEGLGLIKDSYANSLANINFGLHIKGDKYVYKHGQHIKIACHCVGYNKQMNWGKYDIELDSAMYFKGIRVDDIGTKEAKINHSGGTAYINFYQTTGEAKPMKVMKQLYKDYGREGIETTPFVIKTKVKVDGEKTNLEDIKVQILFSDDYDFSKLQMSEEELADYAEVYVDDKDVSLYLENEKVKYGDAIPCKLKVDNPFASPGYPKRYEESSLVSIYIEYLGERVAEYSKEIKLLEGEQVIEVKMKRDELIDIEECTIPATNTLDNDISNAFFKAGGTKIVSGGPLSINLKINEKGVEWAEKQFFVLKGTILPPYGKEIALKEQKGYFKFE